MNRPAPLWGRLDLSWHCYDLRDIRVEALHVVFFFKCVSYIANNTDTAIMWVDSGAQKKKTQNSFPK